MEIETIDRLRIKIESYKRKSKQASKSIVKSNKIKLKYKSIINYCKINSFKFNISCNKLNNKISYSKRIKSMIHSSRDSSKINSSLLKLLAKFNNHVHKKSTTNTQHSNPHINYFYKNRPLPSNL